MSAFKSLTSDNVTVSNTLTFPNRVTIDNIPTGTANRVLQTDGSGIPVYGLNTPTPGTNEQSMWTIGGVSSWQSRSFRYGIYYTRFTSQNWSAAATNTLVMDVTDSSSSQTFGPTAYSNITRTSNTVLLCNTTGLYKITMHAQITNSSLGITTITFNPTVNGLVRTPGIQLQLGIGSVGTISGTIPITMNAGDTLGFRSTLTSGLSGMNSLINNSSLIVECVNTLI